MKGKTELHLAAAPRYEKCLMATAGAAVAGIPM